MGKFRKNFNIIFSGVGGSIGEDNPEETLAKELHRYNKKCEKVDFGLLYNALTEKKLGKGFKERKEFSDLVVMADSGGYQLAMGRIEKGSEEDKIGVYKHQAKNSDYGFCFDEVPTTGDFYDHTTVLEKTLKTNNNIKKQIEIFKSLNTECRIFPIAKVQTEDRGISYDNLLKECDVLMLAGMAANTKIFGDFFAYPFFYKEFRELVGFPNVLHHLGTGTPRTMLPFYLLALEGFFGEDFIYCVDATSYSHSLILRSSICREDGSSVSFKDLTEEEFEEWRDYCLNAMPEVCKDLEAFHNINRRHTLSVKGGLFKVFLISALSYAMGMFVKMVEDPWKFAADNRILTFQQLQSIKELAKARDWNDFYEWKGVFGAVWSRVNPKKTKPLSRSNLDAFF